jgi:hypothetical protein
VDDCFFLTRSVGDAGSGSSTCRGSDQGAFTASGQAPNQRAGSGSAADLGNVALLVVLATEGV